MYSEGHAAGAGTLIQGPWMQSESRRKMFSFVPCGHQSESLEIVFPSFLQHLPFSAPAVMISR